MEAGRWTEERDGFEHVCTLPPHSVLLGFAHDPFRAECYDVRFGFYDIPLGTREKNDYANFLCRSLTDTNTQA
jgi:hypothetical protein